MPKKITKEPKKKITKTDTKKRAVKNSDQIVKEVFLNNNKYALELLTLILPETFMNEVDKKSLELKHDDICKKCS